MNLTIAFGWGYITGVVIAATASYLEFSWWVCVISGAVSVGFAIKVVGVGEVER